MHRSRHNHKRRFALCVEAPEYSNSCRAISWHHEDALTGGTTYGGGYDTNTRERSAYEIELDLRKAYDLLEDMERYSEQCESSVLKIQYARMIVDQKAHIRELEAELRSAY